MAKQPPDDTTLRMLEEIHAAVIENGRAFDGLTARLVRIEQQLTDLNEKMSRALGVRIEPVDSTQPPSGKSNRPH